MGIGAVADGVPEVLKATRLNLRNGATQIKIMAGGGGSSRFATRLMHHSILSRRNLCHR
ncbi:hypothetical protein OH492_09880 [Vibrio chagasii]|nr:hypothetical protein [Vibrio chagasii]